MIASEMSRWERIRAALKGEETDRVPISLWRHWPVEDETPQGLAAATMRWQRDYDFDLVKLSPSTRRHHTFVQPGRLYTGFDGGQGWRSHLKVTSWSARTGNRRFSPSGRGRHFR